MLVAKKGTICLFFLILAILFYYPSLTAYFSQDDFYHLRTIMEKNLWDIPSFFTTWQLEQTFYRPLARETFNLIMYQSFGLNAFSFHLVNLLLIGLIGFVLFFLVKKFVKNSYTPFLAVFLYLFNSIHSIELYYLSSIQQLLATVFLMISLYLYLNSLKKNHVWKTVVSLVLFVMALLSHSMAVIFPGILLLVELFLTDGKRTRIGFSLKVIKNLAPFFVLAIIYLFGSSLLNLPNQMVYQPIFSIKSLLNTFFWYILWVLGLPEMLVDFVGPNFVINPNLIKWYREYLQTVILALSAFIIFLGFLLIKFREHILKTKHLIFFASAFVLTLLPFLPFPQHKFVYYLSFPTVWFACFVAYIFGVVWQKDIRYMKGIILLFLAVYLIISYQTIQINKITHWAAKRANAANYLISDIQKRYPTISSNTVFFFNNDPDYPSIAKEWGSSTKQAFYILSGSDALILLYKDPKLKVYFEGIDELPRDIDTSNVIFYTAKFPY